MSYPLSNTPAKRQIIEGPLTDWQLWGLSCRANTHTRALSHARRLRINPPTPLHNADKWPLIFSSLELLLSDVSIKLAAGPVPPHMSNGGSPEVVQVQKEKIHHPQGAINSSVICIVVPCSKGCRAADNACLYDIHIELCSFSVGLAFVSLRSLDASQHEKEREKNCL